MASRSDVAAITELYLTSYFFVFFVSPSRLLETCSGLKRVNL